MGTFMIWYKYTNREGLHLDCDFAPSYDQARDIMTDLISRLHVRVQLYQWDSELEYYVFLTEEW